MSLFATLLLAHLIADFPLQTNWVFQLKARTWAGVLLHAAIHCVVTIVLLENPLAAWPMWVFLGLMHFTIDWLKLQMQIKYQFLGFILDQTAHVLTLLLLATWPWPFEITGALTSTFLYPAVIYALLPAFFMFLSILAGDLEHFAPDLSDRSKNKALKFKSLSRVAGFPLAVVMTIVRLGEKA